MKLKVPKISAKESCSFNKNIVEKIFLKLLFSNKTNPLDKVLKFEDGGADIKILKFFFQMSFIFFTCVKPETNYGANLSKTFVNDTRN